MTQEEGLGAQPSRPIPPHPRDRRPWTRREFLYRAGAASLALPGAATLLAACTRPGSSTSSSGYALARPDDPVTLPIADDNQAIADGLQPEKNATLQIYNWDAYLWKPVIKAFCERYDCDFEYTTFNNMDEGLAKMRTGQFKFDVFFPTIDVMSRLVAAKLLQPLNHSYIPNLETSVWPVFQDPFYDRGWRYSVPYTVYTTGVGYRTDHVDPDEINAMDNAYEILWDPRFRGKVGIYDDYREAISMALLKNGITDLNTGDPADLAIAKNDLLDLVDSQNARLTINGAYLKLPEDDFYIHQAWSGDIVSGWFYMPKGTPYTVLGYWYPKDRKGVVANDLIGVPRNAEHPVLGHLFLNWILDFKQAMTNYAWLGYQPPQIKADPERLTTTKSLYHQPYVFPWLADAVVRQEDFEAGYMYLETSPTVDDRWHNAWEEITAGAK